MNLDYCIMKIINLYFIFINACFLQFVFYYILLQKCVFYSALPLRIFETCPNPKRGFIKHLVIHLGKKAVFFSEFLRILAVGRCLFFSLLSAVVRWCVLTVLFVTDGVFCWSDGAKSDILADTMHFPAGYFSTCDTAVCEVIKCDEIINIVIKCVPLCVCVCVYQALSIGGHSSEWGWCVSESRGTGRVSNLFTNCFLFFATYGGVAVT